MPVITRGKANYLEAAKEKWDKEKDGKAVHKRARKSQDVTCAGFNMVVGSFGV